MSLSEAAQAIDGTLHGRDVSFDAVTTDTRSLKPGQLFVALRGVRFDGHEFAGLALEQGAAGVLVDRPMPDAEPRIETQDSRLALGRLAASWRRRFHLPLIAVTGSNGKTTIKNMLGVILARTGNGLVTEGNLNNDIGLPLTLLRLRDGDQFAVLEMGMNRPGEIDYLTRLARPTVAVIANAGRAHLSGLSCVEAVARAKGEIINGLDDDGVAVLNADDPYHDLWADLARHRRIMTFGVAPDADVSAEWDAQPGVTAILARTPAGPLNLRLSLLGDHNVINALAAATAALAVGVPLDDIRAGLESMTPVPGRLQPIAGRDGALLLDDTYNANPDSLNAALAVLGAYPGERVVVLGDMGELGSDEEALHRTAGLYARAAGVARLMALGPLAAQAAEAFGDGGEAFDDIDALIDAVAKALGQDTTVLIKGSRRMRMERVVQALGAASKGGPV